MGAADLNKPKCLLAGVWGRLATNGRGPEGAL